MEAGAEVVVKASEQMVWLTAKNAGANEVTVTFDQHDKIVKVCVNNVLLESCNTTVAVGRPSTAN